MVCYFSLLYYCTFIVDGMSVSSSVADEELGYLKDQNSLYKAQLDELQEQLVRVRREGEQGGETKTVGEIKALQNQLGAKSR